MNHSEVAKRYVEYCLGLTNKSSAEGSRCSYEGHRFVSYTTTVAVYHPEHRVLAMTTKRYSNTTARHKDYVRKAADDMGLTVFEAMDPFYLQQANNVKWYTDQAKVLLEKALRARKYTSLGMYRHRLEQAKGYAEAVGLPFNPDDFSPSTLLADQPKLLTKYIARRLDGTYQGAYA